MRINLMLWLSLLLPFCLINLSINITVVTSHCLGHQQSLLLHLKKNLIFEPTKSSKLVHWNQSGDDCCEWNGVACNKGRVIALDLSHEFISGAENVSSLFNLQYLQTLNLAYNDFHSEIHSELKKLKRLRYLNLSNAGFEGQVPIEISYLKKLVTLDLSTTSTSYHALKLEKQNIAMLVQNFTEIRELYLDGVVISAKSKEWSHALSSLKHLQVLSMSSCNLSGPLDFSLSKLHSLSILRLSENNLASPVPMHFWNLPNLTNLQLSGCGLSGIFPENIFQIPSLQVLDLSDNLGLYGPLPDYQHLESLHNLNLSHTNFSGPLPESIHNLRHLSTLDLSNCQFNGTIPNSMSYLTQLVHLDLSFNNFTGPLPSFNRSKALKVLSLNHNNFKGTVPSTHFEGLVNLVSIDLGDNSLVGRVPSTLFRLQYLEKLMLFNNKFDGTLDEFPNAASSLIEMLDLSDNSFQGPIPVSIFQLKRLKLLQLSSNKFNGTIQLDIIERLQNLIVLDLSQNHLSVYGSIKDDRDSNASSFPKLTTLLLASCNLTTFPDFLRNQSRLLALDLSSNQIEGTVPNWIWRFNILTFLNLSNNFLTGFEVPFQNPSPNLLHLDLHSNQFQGPAPFFGKSAVYLDYSNNRFNSITPSDIENHMSNIYGLVLANNSFHGKIPEAFCNISNLRVLDLSHNIFNGMIPKCLTTRSSTLRELNLGGNELNGHISDTFSTSCALRYLDLNENLLRGTIPESLANCQELQVLNLGNNQLTDSFPCFLKKISTLRVMILRSNKFHGDIGCPNINGIWEKLQIVDLSINNFSGTLTPELLRSLVALMPDKDEAGSRFGHLFFDIFDNLTHVDFMSVSATLSKGDKMKFAKMLAAEPTYVIDHLISHVFGEVYGLRRYDASVTIVNKGHQLNFQKILIAFTSLDFSSNQFKGPISEELMNLTALHALNLSQNAFSGNIPWSLSKLKQLESLDLSNNSLSGEIPTEIASLSFLQVMNLSYNHLVGKIPMGTQIQSFEADAFLGNEGLCGPPLTQNCNGGGTGLSPPAYETLNSHSHTMGSIDWNFLSAEVGIAFGLGIFILPLIFWKRWRLWYSKHVDDLLFRIFPQLDFVYEHHGGKTYRVLRWKPY